MLFLFFIFSLFLTPLEGALQKEGVRLQEFACDLAEKERQLHANKVDIELLYEKVEGLQTSLSLLQSQLKSSSEQLSEHPFEARISQIEKNVKNCSSDLSLLKNNLNTSLASLARAEQKLESLDKTLTTDIKTLKNTLQSMIALMEKEGGKSYTVQSGDTLEKIASRHATTIKELKEANHLVNDLIFSGQKLQIP